MEKDVIIAIAMFILAVGIILLSYYLVAEYKTKYKKNIMKTKNKIKATLIDSLLIATHDTIDSPALVDSYFIFMDESGNKYALSNITSSNFIYSYTGESPYIVMKRTKGNNPLSPFVHKVLRTIDFGEEVDLWIDETKGSLNEKYKNFKFEQASCDNSHINIIVIGKTPRFDIFYNYNAKDN